MRLGTHWVAVLFVLTLLALTPMAGIAGSTGEAAAEQGIVFAWNDTELTVSKFLTGDAVGSEEVMNGAKYWAVDPELDNPLFPARKPGDSMWNFSSSAGKKS